MPRMDLLSTNFSGGELSPRLYGRVDVAKYNDAVKTGSNVVFLQHGGVRGRPGTEYLGEVKDSADATRLIPFVFSQDEAYVLEFGDGYMRVWKNGVLQGLPYEITTPYTSFDVFDVDYTQGADTMFLALSSAFPRRLRRFGDQRWVLDNLPFKPPPFDEVGLKQGTLVTLGSAAVGATTATGAAAVWLPSDVGRTLTYKGGIAMVTGYVSTTVVNVNVTTAFETAGLPASLWVLMGSPQATCTPSAKDPVGAAITLTLSISGWRSTDVDKFVQINGGLCKITGFTSDLIVAARIESELTATVAAEASSWSLEPPVWDAVDGYPRTVTLHQQRLVFAGSPKYPQTVWGSRSGLFFDFTKGALDDDSYSFELNSDEINPIQFLSSNRDLMVLTYGGEWTMSGGVEKPITPTNVRAMPQAKAGAANVRPEQVDDELIYIQRGVSALRTLGFRIELGGYQSEQASTLSEHTMSGGVAEVTYAQSPERVLWARKDDGTLVACTTSREQNIRAFAPCSLPDGVVESVATIPENGEDRTYMVVRRTINGTTKRYIERFNWSAYQDCRITKTPASATVTGLGHLALQVVSAVADGVDMGDFTVSAGGQITLPRVAASVTVGKRYTPTIKMLPPEFGHGMGASSGDAVSNCNTKVLFKDTIGCSVNGQPLAFRTFGEDILDEAVEPFSGWKDISDHGWSVDAGEVEITQPQSYPWCLLAVKRRMTANPG
jgi:hypothetical protein